MKDEQIEDEAMKILKDAGFEYDEWFEKSNELWTEVRDRPVNAGS